MDAYGVILSPAAKANFDAINSKIEGGKILKRLNALKVFAHIGTLYDPLYPSAMPPHELYVTYVSHYGIYYSIVEEDKLVHVEYIEDSYRNPFNKFRFTEIPPSEA